jgi:hypothetical protein
MALTDTLYECIDRILEYAYEKCLLEEAVKTELILNSIAEIRINAHNEMYLKKHCIKPDKEQKRSN